MKTAQKTFSLNILSLFTLLVLVGLLLSTCGNATTERKTTPTPTGNTATLTPGRSTVTPLPTQRDQILIFTSQDSTHIWHMFRYNTRTGEKTDIYTTAAGEIQDTQVSADGQWVLFLLDLYPAMQTDVSAKIQIIRTNGQDLQTLSTIPVGKIVGGLEWSPDQRVIAFQENRNVFLLDVVSKTSRLVVPASEDQGFVPRTWLDAMHLYLAPYKSAEIPPLELYLLDRKTTHVQQVLSLPTLGGDFDSSLDGTTLFTCQYLFAMPEASGPSLIEARPATGGQTTTIYRASDYAITALRVASRSSLLFIIHNTGVGNVDTSNNGLWKIKTDGTGLSKLTSIGSDEYILFPTSTQYIWSSISRDGALYAVKVVHTTSPNAPSDLLIGSLGGEMLRTIVSSVSVGTLDIAGWTT